MSNMPGGASTKGDGVYKSTPTYLCVRCQRTFVHWKGMKRVGQGMGTCVECHEGLQLKKDAAKALE